MPAGAGTAALVLLCAGALAVGAPPVAADTHGGEPARASGVGLHEALPGPLGGDGAGGGDPNDVLVEVLDAVLDPAAARTETDTTAEGGASPRITKSASNDPVAPGETVTYTIVIAGVEGCTLTDVRDTMTGPPGSRITTTSPTAERVDELAVTWDDVGPVAPGDAVRLLIGVEVPADALDGAAYAGALDFVGECDGQRAAFHADWAPFPTVRTAEPPGVAPARLPLPATGSTSGLAGLGALALGLALGRLAGPRGVAGR
ncbi:MAG TPA: hypothetical protein VM324_16360 [Egibacteraceae bacterium]|jgi:hypothetical protein|nr:hypothetical protein [Egibacteraceae bacterium]